jgi:hypothetical protein
MRPKSLIEWHLLHRGVYTRVARKLGIDPSFVSKVASGSRRSEPVKPAIEAELWRISRLKPEA